MNERDRTGGCKISQLKTRPEWKKISQVRISRFATGTGELATTERRDAARATPWICAAAPRDSGFPYIFQSLPPFIRFYIRAGIFPKTKSICH